MHRVATEMSREHTPRSTRVGGERAESDPWKEDQRHRVVRGESSEPDRQHLQRLARQDRGVVHTQVGRVVPTRGATESLGDSSRYRRVRVVTGGDESRRSTSGRWSNHQRRTGENKTQGPLVRRWSEMTPVTGDTEANTLEPPSTKCPPNPSRFGH